MKKKDKRGAMFQLKRKKMLEKNLASLQGMRLNIEQQIMTLESAATTSIMVDSLVDAKTEMGRINAKVNVDNLEDLRDELDERTADQEDITNILSEPMGNDMMDDDELLGELDDLEDIADADETREAAKRVMDLPVAPGDDPLVLPTVPVDDPVPIASKEDADELAELAALMN
jgi:charged multivesicular body protein 4A/B